MDQKNDLTRRNFLKLAGIVGGSAILVGCGGGSGDGGSDETPASDENILRVGMEAANAPYNWQTSEESEFTIPIEGIDGAFADGYDVQITKMVGEALGKEPVCVKLAWNGLIDAVQKGTIDLIIAGMTATDERRESIDFTEPYIVDEFCLMVQKGSQWENATSLADFSGAVVIGQKDTLLDEVIDEIPDVEHATPVDSIPSEITALKNGTCDAIVFNQLAGAGYLAANPDLVAIHFEEGQGFSQNEPCNIGLAKGQDDLLAQLDAVIAGISEEERMELWNAAVERQPA